MYSLLESYMEELKSTRTVDEYEVTIKTLIQLLRQGQYEEEIVQNIRNKGAYINNTFSDKATKENMLKAKENLLFYLEGVLKENQKLKCENLELYLQNFYLFLEAFKENIPDKRATISVDDLQKIKIVNEYDLQHLLYAALKPLYADIRKEVTDDSGVGTIRSDLQIPSLNAIIETKCTRKSMLYKKLIEEMEADIVHYNAAFICFYIYDKEKIIKEKQAFETYFNQKFNGKEVKVFVLQPVNL